MMATLIKVLSGTAITLGVVWFWIWISLMIFDDPRSDIKRTGPIVVYEVVPVSEEIVTIAGDPLAIQGEKFFSCEETYVTWVWESRASAGSPVEIEFINEEPIRLPGLGIGPFERMWARDPPRLIEAEMVRLKAVFYWDGPSCRHKPKMTVFGPYQLNPNFYGPLASPVEERRNATAKEAPEIGE